jgi:hypothetical protein
VPEPKRAEAPWTCPSCSKEIATAYCPTCGERASSPRDLTLRGLFRQLLQAVSSVDGRLLRSLRFLIVKPGALTAAYVQGQRKPFLGPFQLFLVANVLFVAVQGLGGMNVFSSTLDSHLHIQDWKPIAQRLVARRLEATHTTLEAYAPSFNRAVAFNAKSLVIVMTIPFSLLLPVLLYRKRRPFGVHVVFAVHVYGFLLVLWSVSLGIAVINVWLGGAGIESAWMDNALTIFNMAGCATYLYLAIGRVYRVQGVARLVTTLAFSAGVALLALGYRLGLLVLTLYAV